MNQFCVLSSSSFLLLWLLSFCLSSLASLHACFAHSWVLCHALFCLLLLSLWFHWCFWLRFWSQFSLNLAQTYFCISLFGTLAFALFALFFFFVFQFFWRFFVLFLQILCWCFSIWSILQSLWWSWSFRFCIKVFLWILAFFQWFFGVFWLLLRFSLGLGLTFCGIFLRFFWILWKVKIALFDLAWNFASFIFLKSLKSFVFSLHFRLFALSLASLH